MNYGELKLICLQKVFAVSDGRLVEDDGTREYLTAIPGAANEGMALLATAGRMLKRKLVIEGEGNPSVRPEGGQLPYIGGPSPAGGRHVRYDLGELAEDFYSLDADGVYLERDGRYTRTADFSVEAGRVLVLPAGAGIWTIWYNAYPQPITPETAEDYVLPLAPEAAAILPLYIASQIYKDDDPALSAQYRNEFEIGRDALLRATREQVGGGRGAWTSVSGWW